MFTLIVQGVLPGLQIILSLALFVEGYRTYSVRPGTSLYRSYYLLILMVVVWLFFDGIATFINLMDPAFAGQVNRIGELFLILAIPFFHLFYPTFPPAGKRKMFGEGLPVLRGYGAFSVIESIAFLLALITLFGSTFEPYINVSEIAIILTNRVFLFLVIFLIYLETITEAKSASRDPRTLQLNILADSLRNFFLAGILIVGFHPLHQSIALTNVAIALAMFFLLRLPGEMMSNRAVDHRKRLTRILSAIISTGVILPLPVYLFSGTQAPANSTDPRLQIILVLLPAVSIPLYSFIFQFLISGFRTIKASASAGISFPFRTEFLDSSTIRKGIFSLIQNLYSPGHLSIYTLVHESGGKPGNHLVRDTEHSQVGSQQALPPGALFPEEILNLFREMPPDSSLYRGATLHELMWYSEQSAGENTLRQIRSLYHQGARAILVLRRQVEHTWRHDPDSIRNASHITGCIVIGQTSIPLHGITDLFALTDRSQYLTALLQMDELARTTEKLRNRVEEQHRELMNTAEESPQHRAYSAASFVYRQEGVMADLMEQIKRFASRSAPILVNGETGTGKEHVARILHDISGRPGSFVALNCSAIPDDLIENELFGHIRGAYTGAEGETEGLVGRANGGTLFLDEIGEMPLEGQVKLLRLVQEGQYEKLGSSETLHTDARFVFATNRNLEDEVNQSNFRSDLFYRISTFEIRIPPLRERPEDIPLLTDHFLGVARDTFHRPGLKITREVSELFLNYRWPGNVRELENVIMRAVVLSETDLIDTDSLPEFFRGKDDFFQKRVQLEKVAQQQTAMERELLLEALVHCGGNQRKAAELLNISRGSLQYRMKQYGLTAD